MRFKTARIDAISIALSLLTASAAAAADRQSISDVALDVQTFNPALGEHVRLSYALAEPDEVTVRVYDPDGGLVSTVVAAESQDVGTHEVLWDGRDVDGREVTDEAYTFTIETASGAVYDPTTFSGGVVGDITDAHFSEDGIVIYMLPSPARVLIRLGVHNGPMLKTLVDWKPRVAGSVSEYWDGYDEHDLMRLRELENFSVLITYVSLPETTVIAYGNSEETYRAYKLGRAGDRSQKPARARRPDPEVRLRPANLVPPAWSRAPRIAMTFPKHAEAEGDGVPEVQDIIEVRIDADPSDREYLLQDQFEVIFFVDNVYFAEAERGYLPLNWRWELHQVPPGEHVLTANVSSFAGQVGVVSRKVNIVEPD